MDDLTQWEEQRLQEEEEQQWYDFLRDKEERYGREGLIDPFLEDKYSSEELEQIDYSDYDADWPEKEY